MVGSRSTQKNRDTNDSIPPHRFGSHLSIAGGVSRAVEEAHRLGFHTVQIFVKNQRQWRASALKTDDLDRWFALRADRNFGPPVAHATYLINLAADSPGLATQSRQAFAEELVRCDILEIPYLVIHPGAARGQTTEQAVARVADALNRIFADQPALRAMPLLETTAGQGSSLGRTFEELAAIIERVQEPHRIGVCLDTCHVFAAGYDIRDREKFADMLRTIEQTVGLDRIRCLHLNDSRADLGARVDRHEHIGRGRIGRAGFENVLRESRLAGKPMILETAKGVNEAGREWDRVNLQRLRTIARSAAPPQKAEPRRRAPRSRD